MISGIFKLRPSLAPKALLLAGLSFFCCLRLPADDTVPVRETLPTSTPSPVSSPSPPPVSQEDLKASEARLSQDLSQFASKSQNRDAEIDKDLDAIRNQLENLGKAQSDQAVGLSASASAIADLDKRLDDGLEKVEGVRSEIEHKGERMENLLDLIDTVKRDLNDDSKEIAELKAETERLNGLVKSPTDDSPWWDQMADWKYLPATATILSVLAIVLVSTRQ